MVRGKIRKGGVATTLSPPVLKERVNEIATVRSLEQIVLLVLYVSGQKEFERAIKSCLYRASLKCGNDNYNLVTLHFIITVFFNMNVSLKDAQN